MLASYKETWFLRHRSGCNQLNERFADVFRSIYEVVKVNHYILVGYESFSMLNTSAAIK